MKPLHLAATLAAVLATSACAPGMGVALMAPPPTFYGEIDMDEGVPPVIFAAPIVVIGGGMGAPIYLHVPPGYERHWARHCHEYNACRRPVYFVREGWYNNVYAPRHGYRERERGYGDGGERGYDRGDRGEGRYRRDRGEDRRDNRGGYDRGGYGGGGAVLGRQPQGGGGGAVLGRQPQGGGAVLGRQPQGGYDNGGGGYERRRGGEGDQGGRGRGRGRGRDEGDD